MSVYPANNNNSNVFNADDFLSPDEITYQENGNSSGSGIDESDLNDYVKKSGSVMSGALQLPQIIINGMTQTTAYSTSEKSKLDTNTSKLENITKTATHTEISDLKCDDIQFPIGIQNQAFTDADKTQIYVNQGQILQNSTDITTQGLYLTNFNNNTAQNANDIADLSANVDIIKADTLLNSTVGASHASLLTTHATKIYNNENTLNNHTSSISNLTTDLTNLTNTVNDAPVSKMYIKLQPNWNILSQQFYTGQHNYGLKTDLFHITNDAQFDSYTDVANNPNAPNHFYFQVPNQPKRLLVKYSINFQTSKSNINTFKCRLLKYTNFANEANIILNESSLYQGRDHYGNVDFNNNIMFSDSMIVFVYQNERESLALETQYQLSTSNGTIDLKCDIEVIEL
jgi:hypothetical protein